MTDDVVRDPTPSWEFPDDWVWSSMEEMVAYTHDFLRQLEAMWVDGDNWLEEAKHRIPFGYEGNYDEYLRPSQEAYTEVEGVLRDRFCRVFPECMLASLLQHSDHALEQQLIAFCRKLHFELTTVVDARDIDQPVYMTWASSGMSLATKEMALALRTFIGRSSRRWSSSPVQDSLTKSWAGVEGAHAADSSKSVGCALVRKGDAWELTYDGEAAIVKATTGMVYIARLLVSKGVPVHVLDLQGLQSASRQGTTDDRYRTECEARLEQINQDRRDAKERGNSEALEALDAEVEKIGRVLSLATDKRGKPRALDSEVEAARSRVRSALRTALEKIARVHSAAHLHLSRSIQGRNGLAPIYSPEVDLTWLIEE